MQRRPQHRRPARHEHALPGNPEEDGQQDAHSGPGDRHEELVPGGLRFALHARDATEQEERDRLDADTQDPRHQRVAHLVGEDRQEEEDGCQHARDDRGGRTGLPVGVYRGEVAERQQAGHEQEDHDPAEVHLDRDPEELPYAHGRQVEHAYPPRRVD